MEDMTDPRGICTQQVYFHCPVERQEKTLKTGITTITALMALASPAFVIC